LKVTFNGVRGSCPCPCDANQRYGGNTASVAIEVEGQPPLLLDLGTGLRKFGLGQPLDGTFRATALVTHIHWDHVQGLPFFPPIHFEGSHLDVYGPHQEEGPFAEVFAGLMRRPYFPIGADELEGDVVFHDATSDTLAIGDAKVLVRPVPHKGPTVGYRIEWDGVSIAYISDHQAPDDLDSVEDEVLELADGVDLLIHDAQYTVEDWAKKKDWGHCTVDYAVKVGARAGAHQLVLFHHDPAHSDDTLDRLLAEARELGAATGVDRVDAAYEGLVLDLAPRV
jgi:phosphoribosyl 1,2-cyclic phosphodiesterase